MNSIFPWQTVKVVGITQPDPNAIIENYDPGKNKQPSAEDLIAYCARVSNPSNQHNFDTADKLLAYCFRNKHWSPFEIVNVVFEVVTTRDIGRQILRHRSLAAQEFSQRYADVSAIRGEDIPFRTARVQDKTNRQKSIDASDDEQLNEYWIDAQRKVHQLAYQTYQQALQRGIAKEVARVILPEGLTMSRMYIQGSLRSWIHYCDVRLGNGTQTEHIDIAQKIWIELEQQFPFLSKIDLTDISSHQQ